MRPPTGLRQDGPDDRMTTPRISVAMSVFNNARHLAPAIRSILAQTEGDFEFIIVNDGSTDSSGQIIDRFAAEDTRIRPIHQENRGLVASLNRIIEAARAPLIARMDGDDIALPARFAAQLAWLEANPDVGVLGTGCTVITDDGQLSRRRIENPVSTDAILDELKYGPPLCHPSVMMRTDAVRAIGGYRRAYRHCEDYDLWLRLSRKTAMANLSDRLLNYRQSESQVSNRHAFLQNINAAIAWEAHVERMAGRPDPTDLLDVLPPIDALDDVFGRSGVADAVRTKVALGIVYSPNVIKGDGFNLILDHIRRGGETDGLARTVLRLVKFGAPVRAVRLAMALLQ